MSDYIDRQAAIDAVMILPQKWDGMYIQDLNCRLRDALNALPSAEVEPVKYGRWDHGKEISRTMLGNEIIAIDYEDWHCSVCGRRYKEYVLPYRYCPNCGAKMDAPTIIEAEEGEKE